MRPERSETTTEETMPQSERRACSCACHYRRGFGVPADNLECCRSNHETPTPDEGWQWGAARTAPAPVAQERCCYACGDDTHVLSRAGRYVCRDLTACSARLNARLGAPVAQEGERCRFPECRCRHEEWAHYDRYDDGGTTATHTACYICEGRDPFDVELNYLRDDHARLTAENERLTRERDAYKALVHDKDTLIWTAISQRDEARAEITALRARAAELEGERRWHLFPVERPPIGEDVLISWGYDEPLLGTFDGDQIVYEAARRKHAIVLPVWWSPTPDTPEELPRDAAERLRAQEER
jgi:hypothetical protein